MMDYILKFTPFIVALIFYFVRLERRLAIISNDLKWIKNNCEMCQPINNEDTA